MYGIKAGGAYRFSKPPFFILSIPFILSEHQPRNPRLHSVLLHIIKQSS